MGSHMTLNLSIPETTELRPRIVVFGVGGAGGNAVNNMIEASLEGVDFVVANTDAQALTRSKSEKRIQMGAAITEGLGAGARPEVGEQSAEDSIDDIREQLAGAHMVFITAGMGGGTGTGAGPVVARAAREMGILTVGVVTKPFHFEGSRRMKLAEAGIEQLQDHVDTLIVIPNDRLRDAISGAPLQEAFRSADDVLRMGVKGISDIITCPGLVNVDFADVRSVMTEAGTALLGIGIGSGRSRAVEAAQAAIASPLLETERIDGAKGCVINISGGKDMTLEDMTTASEVIYDVVDPEANIIVGAVVDEALEGEIHVTVIATGFENKQPYRSERSRSVPGMLNRGEPEENGARIPEFLRRRQQQDNGSL